MGRKHQQNKVRGTELYCFLFVDADTLSWNYLWTGYVSSWKWL